jgi:GH25 family lysozyme M1 (1,4-beta-N-acetylmuramidase)
MLTGSPRSITALNGLLCLLSPLALAACSGAPSESLGSSDEPVTEKCGASANGAVQGRDVSVYQGDFDWAATHVDFGYARISNGLYIPDDTFDGNWSRMKAAHIRRGAYQYFEPSQSAKDQADMVVSKIGKLGAGDLPAMIDVEVTDGRSPSEMASAIRTWLETVEKGTGLRPLIYVGSYFWQDNVQATDFGQYPIVIAAYGTACPSLPPGWKNWTFWQYSDGDGKLDHDVFNGSLADLEKLEGGQTTAPVTATPTPAVARRADGYLEVFERGGGDVLYHDWQESNDDGKWSGWADLGGVLYSDVTVVLNGDDREELFAQNDKKELVHRWLEASGKWSGWASLGGELTSDIAVILDAEKHMHAFARGTNDELYVVNEAANGSWGKWESLGGTITSSPSVAMNKDGRLEVFALGEKGVPYHKAQAANGGWSGWDSLGGELSTRPTAVTDDGGNLEVFALGTNKEIYRNAQKTPGGAWTGWHSLGGVGTSNVAVGKNADGRLEIFVRGKEDGLDHAWIKDGTDDFSAFESLGGKFTSDPSVALNKGGGLEVFARGTNDALFHAWQDAKDKGGWTGFASLGGKVE